MKDSDCVCFLQWALPQLRMRWPGFRKVRKQVCKRIDRRLRELGLVDVEAYREYLQRHPSEWSVLDRFCRIPISRFYRDRGVFDCLREDVLPQLTAMAQAADDRTLRCWSAGCASGEEPYTLNILWQRCLQPRFPLVRLSLVATDSNPAMLERARRGCYSKSSLKDFPKEWLADAFETRGEEFCVSGEFRGNIDWQLQDLRRESPAGPFHLILCRHVAFTYFDEPLQRETLDRLLDPLVPGGFLVTGKQEPLPQLPAQLQEYGHRLGLYRKVTLPAPTSS